MHADFLDLKLGKRFLDLTRKHNPLSKNLATDTFSKYEVQSSKATGLEDALTTGTMESLQIASESGI